jgi:hypothetical protein
MAGLRREAVPVVANGAISALLYLIAAQVGRPQLNRSERRAPRRGPSNKPSLQTLVRLESGVGVQSVKRALP